MSAYYNEIDPYCVQWLKNLIAAGHIAPGEVDNRSITEVDPDDLKGFVQAHFFAGIGGWPLALELAGWPAEREVWTGSCPCQPFSIAGQQNGADDSRHLWPAFYRLLAKRHPATVFGEQVASQDGFRWLAAVRFDLASKGYALGAADLAACGVGAYHVRRRLFWVADADHARLERGELGRALREVRPEAPLATFQRRRSPWADADWLDCADGKARPTQPGICPVADGIPGRVGRLRAYGNAIVPQVAAQFIGAFMEVRP